MSSWQPFWTSFKYSYFSIPCYYYKIFDVQFSFFNIPLCEIVLPMVNHITSSRHYYFIIKLSYLGVLFLQSPSSHCQYNLNLSSQFIELVSWNYISLINYSSHSSSILGYGNLIDQSSSLFSFHYLYNWIWSL